jgi:hypothetical protein
VGCPRTPHRPYRRRLANLDGTFVEAAARSFRSAEPLQTFNGLEGHRAPQGRPTGGRLPNLSAARTHPVSYDQPSIATLVEKPQGSETVTRALPLRIEELRRSRAGCVPPSAHPAEVTRSTRGHPEHLQTSRPQHERTSCTERRNDVQQQNQRGTLLVRLAKDPATNTQHSRNTHGPQPGSHPPDD